MKEIKENVTEQRDIPCSWIGRLNIIGMSVVWKLIYGFKPIIQNSSKLSCINGQVHAKIHMKMQRSRPFQMIIGEKPFGRLKLHN